MASIEPMHRNKPNITYLLTAFDSVLGCDPFLTFHWKPSFWWSCWDIAVGTVSWKSIPLLCQHKAKIFISMHYDIANSHRIYKFRNFNAEWVQILPSPPPPPPPPPHTHTHTHTHTRKNKTKTTMVQVVQHQIDFRILNKQANKIPSSLSCHISFGVYLHSFSSISLIFKQLFLLVLFYAL